MNVLKMGSMHRELRMNCQDATGQFLDKLKVVCDGCSEGKYSEVGAKLFCQLLIDKYKTAYLNGKIPNTDIKVLIYSVMDELVRLFGSNYGDMKDYLSFTILVVEKWNDDTFCVFYCGDGYVIENKDGSISFTKLDCGEYPQYLIYNYIPQDFLKEYKNGVSLQWKEFKGYENIGVASDGVRFAADLPDDNQLKIEMRNILLSNKTMKMKFFFNRNESVFQDDFSIVY